MGKKKQRSSTKLTQQQAKDELDEWQRANQLLKPDDQLELTDNELKEIYARVINTGNPQIPDGWILFNMFEGAFVPAPVPTNYAVLYERKGTMLHILSEEAKKQFIAEGKEPPIEEPDEEEEAVPSIKADATEDVGEEDFSTTVSDTTPGPEKTEEEDTERGEGEVEAEETEKAETEDAEPSVAEAKADEGEDEIIIKSGPKKLTNQFNFCERAAQTYTSPIKDSVVQTEPPPKCQFGATVLQWIIFDGYTQDYEKKELEKALEKERKEKDKAPVGKVKAEPVRKGKGPLVSEATAFRMLDRLRTLERMINQNTFYDIAIDYRYWEDPSDEYREGNGTLLPLWKFTYEKTKKTTVTDLCWNPWYYDLFAVCYGSLDFTKPTEGALCLYTLKNPSFPDYICMADCSVMCCDINKDYPYMIVIGLEDGNVFVYNIHLSTKKPQYRSNSVTNKHGSIVWEVKWVPDLPDGELNFYSAGADGNINNWVLTKNELVVTTIITLYLDKEPAPGPDGTLFKLKGSASAILFHPTTPTVYLVGTEEGSIYKCSTHYSSTFLLTYNAHHLPVYRLDYNKFNTDIFISCSGDWRIKIWEDNRLEPLFVFDLGASVGDVEWAPYSSTVFAAVTIDGRCHIFDLNVNKYKPICVQAVVSKRRNKITRLAFNGNLPIIIIGDDKGCITTLKLSPNLRVMCKPPKKQQHLDQTTLQNMKLDKILALVREPTVLPIPIDPSLVKED